MDEHPTPDRGTVMEASERLLAAADRFDDAVRDEARDEVIRERAERDWDLALGDGRC